MSLTVSLFTPTHDTHWLRQAYASIKDQPFHEWIVVYNNGAEPIDFGDARVKAIVIPCRTDGWVGPLKRCACAQATGDILLELDHDDQLLPGAIAAVQAAFADEAVGFVYSNAVHEGGERYGEAFGWKLRAHALGHEVVSFPPTPEAVSRIWYAPNHLRAFRRSVYEAVGGYSDQMRVLDDQDLMCRLYAVTKFLHLDRPLYLYRIHGQNSWLKNGAEIQANTVRLHDDYIGGMVMTLPGRKLDLGGRFNRAPGYESVDLKDADVIADLNARWPLEDDTVAVIRAYDVFEHLRDPLHVMRECYRVLKPGGWIIGQVPSTDGRGAFQDPTHVSFWNENSFLYYMHRDWAKYIDTPVRFQAVRLWTTERDARQVCWTRFNLLSLKGGYRPPGLLEV